jgi:hypothetical protein
VSGVTRSPGSRHRLDRLLTDTAADTGAAAIRGTGTGFAGADTASGVGHNGARLLFEASGVASMRGAAQPRCGSPPFLRLQGPAAIFSPWPEPLPSPPLAERPRAGHPEARKPLARPPRARARPAARALPPRRPAAL